MLFDELQALSDLEKSVAIPGLKNAAIFEQATHRSHHQIFLHRVAERRLSNPNSGTVIPKTILIQSAYLLKFAVKRLLFAAVADQKNAKDTS